MSTTSADATLTPPPPISPSRGLLPSVGLGVVLLACLLAIYSDSIKAMVVTWGSEQYSHAFTIPFIAFYLFWLRARDLENQNPSGSWSGLALIAMGLVLQVLGTFSAVYLIAQYGLVISVVGIAVSAAGLRSLKILWVPLIYLVFMVPLADFLEQRLTTGLQLLSSQIGVAVIRLAGISVFVQGNVIDLGVYKLQVAEACSGMRYLFPLMSFGFLCSVLFRGRWWQRLIVFLSTIPITIAMNSFRVGVIGILVNDFGIEQAEGFLHDFEGWVVFMACVVILFIEIAIFARIEKQKFLQIFGLDIPVLGDLTSLLGRARPNPQVLAATAILVVAAIASLIVTRPPTLIPARVPLQTFPLHVAAWEGKEDYIERFLIDAAGVSDYALITYARPSDQAPVNLWVAYYDAQAKGVGVHSPQACLPGGGWRIEKLEDRVIPNVGPNGGSLQVNRVLIALGSDRQVVYYWFAQRGRIITSEYLVKWYIFWDGLTRNRTDGSLVRVSTFVGDVSQLDAADKRLEDFVRDMDPKLNYYLPGSSVEFKLPAPP